MKDLQKIFSPKSIALFGASDRNGSVGRALAENLLSYKGKVYYLNPRLKLLFGKKVYSSIIDVKEIIDLAIIAVPSKVAVDIVKDLAKVNCKNIIIISSGFNEVGSDSLTEELMSIVKKHKMNLIGPNCLGVLNLDNNLDAIFSSKEKLVRPANGKISIISQSGALGIAILDFANFESLKINKFISYGNALDVDESDLLEYLSNDKGTDVILCYIEGVKNGRRFFNVLKKVSLKKKVIVIKGGISRQGNKAAMSHTAAIAGSSEVFSSAVRQAGGYPVDSITDMFNLARLFSTYKKIDLKNIQIITNGGGFGVLTSDQLDINGIKLAEMSDKTRKKIKKLVPSYAVVKNPMDLTGDADNERFIKAIRLCLKDKSISAIAVLFLFQLPAIDHNIIKELKMIRKSVNKPLFILAIGGKDTDKFIKELEQNNIICFRDPKFLARTIKYVKSD